MKLEALIKAFKDGEQSALPEELKFLLDPDFKAEIEELGPKDRIKAAAQVLSDQGGKVDEDAVGKLAGAMKQAGLLGGQKKEEGDSEEEAASTEEGAAVAPPVEGEEEEEEQAVDEEGNPVEGEEEGAQAVDEEGNPVEGEEPGTSAEGVDPALAVQPKGTDDPSVPNEALKEDGVEGGAPALDGTEEGAVAGEGLEDRILRRALAAIKSLLISD